MHFEPARASRHEPYRCRLTELESIGLATGLKSTIEQHVHGESFGRKAHR